MSRINEYLERLRDPEYYALFDTDGGPGLYKLEKTGDFVESAARHANLLTNSEMAEKIMWTNLKKANELADQRPVPDDIIDKIQAIADKTSDPVEKALVENVKLMYVMYQKEQQTGRKPVC